MRIAKARVRQLLNESGDTQTNALVRSDGELVTVLDGVVVGQLVDDPDDSNFVIITDERVQTALRKLASFPDSRDIITPDNDLTPENEADLLDKFLPWQLGDAFRLNEIRSHDGSLWRCIQAHTANDPAWTPENVHALWVWHFEPTPTDPYPQWVQPTGAHDAYPAGATVTHNGKIWDNTHGNGNVWEPGVFGWAERAA